MSILEKHKTTIDSYWIDRKMEDLCGKWIRGIEDSLETSVEARKNFNQPAPLRAYTCVSGLNKAVFSLRFKGQSVAELKMSDRKTLLTMNSDMKRTNLRDFKYKPESLKNSWDWKQDPISKAFRAHFKENYKTIGDYLPSGSKSSASEHHVESLVLEEMQKSSKDKFGGSCYHIQPVMISGCPFQCPVPISPSGGVTIRPERGNIDILARTKEKNLSVWELKKPEKGLSDNPHIQAFAYAYALLKMLRSNHSENWYRIFGFGNYSDKPLTIEAVAVLSPKSEQGRNTVLRNFEKFVRENAAALKCGQDTIKFRLAFYDFGEDDNICDPRNVRISESYSFLLNEKSDPDSLYVKKGGANWIS